MSGIQSGRPAPDEPDAAPAPAAAIGETGGRLAFRYPDFRLFIGIRFLSILALQAQNVAVGWFVYDLTSSAYLLGLVGLAAFLPALGLALVTGHVADRFDRRIVLMVACLAMALVSTTLLILTLSGSTRVWPIFVLVVLFASGRAFAVPAGQALLPNLVPVQHFANAVAWSSSVLQIATISGPAVGGLLYAFGAPATFALTASSLYLSAALAFAIRTRPTTIVRERASWSTLLAGLAYIRAKPVILGAVSLDLFAVLLGGATALMPVFARDILHTGPWGLGLLRSAPAVGAMVTGVLLAYRPLRRRAGLRMFQAVALFGLATIGFGLSTSLPLSLLCLTVLGASDMVSVYVRQTLVQLETPDAMRGRVAAVNTVFIGASNELGEFESGVLAGLLGAVPAVIVGGVGTIAVAFIWARLFPPLFRLDRLGPSG